VTEPDAALAPGSDEQLIGGLNQESVLDALGGAGRDIRVQRCPCASRLATAAAWPAPSLELRGHRHERRHVTGEPARTADAAPAALRGAERGAGRDQPFEGAPQGDAGELASGCEHLLSHERVAARAFGDQQKRRGRWASAFDRLDQLAELGPGKRRNSAFTTDDVVASEASVDRSGSDRSSLSGW